MTKRIAIIGAGVVGLACARQLARAGGENTEVYILEAGPRIAEGVTSRNSGVIHSPLNYAPGTLKGSLCARGRELLYEWCAKAGVAHRQTGKLIVATTPQEEAELESIRANALAHDATEVRLIGSKELHELEPAAQGIGALFSPRTGIVDPYELSRSFLRDAENHGATLVLNAAVQSVETLQNAVYRLQTAVGPIEADVVINSAGLYADETAALAGAGRYKIYPWRGDYFTLRPGHGRKFERLIYPVKMKSDPGLGVHLTIDLQGKLRLGPDVELITRKDDFSPREEKKERFLQAAQKIFPWATADMLTYDTCGIRPKLRGPDDKAEKDFVIAQDRPGWINLVGIESPGLTASMAIAEKVASIESPSSTQ